MGPLKKNPAGERRRRAGPPAAPAAGFLGDILEVSSVFFPRKSFVWNLVWAYVYIFSLFDTFDFAGCLFKPGSNHWFKL
jgi:hypothetical protein